MRNITDKTTTIVIIICVNLCIAVAADAQEEQGRWIRKKVDWRAGNGREVQALHLPDGSSLPTRSGVQVDVKTAEMLPQEGLVPFAETANTVPAQASSVTTITIQSPPLEGFTPYVAASITKANSGDLDFVAIPSNRVTGRYPSGVQPETDYMIGIFDTGASAHVLGYENALRAGIVTGGLLSGNESIVSGASTDVPVYVSLPLGLFVDGLGAVDPCNLELDQAGMVGLTNMAVMVGQEPDGQPDLFTAIGSPLSVYYTTVIDNEQTVSLERGDKQYTGPDVRIYEHDDQAIPQYDIKIPLELRPLGAANVQYIPSLDSLGGLGGLDFDDILGGGGFSMDYSPATPSIITGNGAQSLFFVHSVDLYEGQQQALDKTRFMLDTGAQGTIIGPRVAARLRLNLQEPDFWEEIKDVAGSAVLSPGFYLDTIDIPALGAWLSYKNVPVVLFDVSSPEGGKLDGIIGMNLFTEFNLVLRGGGLGFEDDPSLSLELISPPVSDDPNVMEQ